jgi:hypothetical protein
MASATYSTASFWQCFELSTMIMKLGCVDSIGLVVSVILLGPRRVAR